jgi:hypothetical protein
VFQGTPAWAEKMVYDETMPGSTPCRLTDRQRRYAVAMSSAFLSLVITACGGSVVRAGTGVGVAAEGLRFHADNSARTAEVCLLQDSLAAQSGAVEKPMAETCRKAQKNDLLWRRSLVVMSLYGERLSAAAAGEEAETSGKLEAALSGVNGPDWSDAEDQSARDAVSQLVGQMSSASSSTRIDLNKLVQDAAPPIKTLCDSLHNHFDSELRDLESIRKDVDKKSSSRAIRRCGTFETHTICVADTVVDRMVYAEIYARVAAIENATYDARDSVLRFCAAHDKLAEAAQNGQIGKKETYLAIVEAAKAVPLNQATWESDGTTKSNSPTAGAKAAAPSKK